MHRLIFLWVLSVLPLAAKPVFHDQPVYPNPVFKLDLDTDGKPDVRIDVSRAKTHPSDPYYLATPLGSSAIAAARDITRSFSNGTRVRLAKLDFKPAPHALKTGGVYRDWAGNFITDGWGAPPLVDDSGKVLFPKVHPAHHVDHFLVRLVHGVAWVALDSRPFTHPGARLNVRWGYLENPGDEFTLRIKDSHKLVKIEARFTGSTTFTVKAVNHSGWMAGVWLRYPDVIYRASDKSVTLIHKKEYEILHPHGGDAAVYFPPNILWGYARVKTSYDISDFVTRRDGKPFHPDLKNGEFWYETRVNNEVRKIRILR